MPVVYVYQCLWRYQATEVQGTYFTKQVPPQLPVQQYDYVGYGEHGKAGGTNEHSSQDVLINAEEGEGHRHSYHHINHPDTNSATPSSLSTQQHSGRYLPQGNVQDWARNESLKGPNNTPRRLYPNHPYPGVSGRNDYGSNKLVENDLPMIMGAGSNKGSSGKMRHFDTNIFYSSEVNEVCDEDLDNREAGPIQLGGATRSEEYHGEAHRGYRSPMSTINEGGKEAEEKGDLTSRGIARYREHHFSNQFYHHQQQQQQQQR